MAELTIRRNGGKAVTPSISREGDPFRMMRQLLGWDPFQEVMPTGRGETLFSPAFEVKEGSDAYTFKADVPGVKEKDLEVTLTGNRLTVTGRREEEKEEKGTTYYAYERSFGSFSRSFTLPEGADEKHVQADLESGVLTIAIPKRPEVQPKKIAVSTTGKGPSKS
jgi:HSP20 family protein